jgi:hypothetical protein
LPPWPKRTLCKGTGLFPLRGEKTDCGRGVSTLVLGPVWLAQWVPCVHKTLSFLYLIEWQSFYLFFQKKSL